MKKILVSMFLLVLGLCLVGCNLLEKAKNVTCNKYENCAVFTFADFSVNETISFELERTCLGEGAIYYKVNLIAGVLSINYQERWHDVVQPLGEFSADDKMPINGAGGYVEGDKIMIIFESDSPIVGEIIIAFTEESLNAVKGDLQHYEQYITLTTATFEVEQSEYDYICGSYNIEFNQLYYVIDNYERYLQLYSLVSRKDIEPLDKESGKQMFKDKVIICYPRIVSGSRDFIPVEYRYYENTSEIKFNWVNIKDGEYPDVEVAYCFDFVEVPKDIFNKVVK